MFFIKAKHKNMILKISLNDRPEKKMIEKETPKLFKCPQRGNEKEMKQPPSNTEENEDQGCRLCLYG